MCSLLPFEVQNMGQTPSEWQMLKFCKTFLLKTYRIKETHIFPLLKGFKHRTPKQRWALPSTNPSHLGSQGTSSPLLSNWDIPFLNGDTRQLVWTLKLLGHQQNYQEFPKQSSARKNIQDLRWLGSKEMTLFQSFSVGLEKYWLKVSLTHQFKVTCFCTFFLSRQQCYLWR